MNINYQLTKQDYIEFNIYHMGYSNSLRKLVFVQRYIVSIIFLIAPFIITKFIDIPLWYWLSIFVIVYILWVIFYPKHLRRSMGKRISRMVDEGKNAGMFDNQSLTLSLDGIINIGSLDESKTKYEAVEKVAETNDYVFIYISSIKAYIIPIRAFVGLNQRNEFVNYLSSKVDEHRLKK